MFDINQSPWTQDDCAYAHYPSDLIIREEYFRLQGYMIQDIRNPLWISDVTQYLEDVEIEAFAQSLADIRYRNSGREK